MANVVVVCGYYFVVTCLFSMGRRGEQLIRMLLQILFVGLVLDVCLYVLNLPFMILGLASPFFREWLYGSLGLNPAAKESDIAPSPQGTDTPYSRLDGNQPCA